MSINIEVRKKQLESLNQYIKSSKDNVQAILKQLGWTAKKVLENGEERVKCPLNTGHRTTIENAPKHIEKCNLRCAGYDIEEPFLSEPLNDPKASISLDNSKKVEIVNKVKQTNPKFKTVWNSHTPDPMTADRLMTTYSPDERLTIYNYCVKNTVGPTSPAEVTFMNDDKIDKEDNPTYEQLLQQLRDSKRRRTKYKSVHTNKKTYTEVMRELIDNQMDIYKEWVSERQKQEAKKEEINITDECLVEDYDKCLGNYENVQNYYSNVPDYFSDEPNQEDQAEVNQTSHEMSEIDEYNKRVEEFLNKTMMKSPDRPRSSVSGHSNRSSSWGRKRNGHDDRYYEKNRKYEDRRRDDRRSSRYEGYRGGMRHHDHRQHSRY